MEVGLFEVSLLSDLYFKPLFPEQTQYSFEATFDVVNLDDHLFDLGPVFLDDPLEDTHLTFFGIDLQQVDSVNALGAYDLGETAEITAYRRAGESFTQQLVKQPFIPSLSRSVLKTLLVQFKPFHNFYFFDHVGEPPRHQ